MTIISVEDFSNTPEDRANIVILSQHDFSEAMQSYDNGSFLLDEEICYLVKPDPEEIEDYPVLQQLKKDNQLKSGSILILDNAEEDSYLPYDTLLKRTVEYQLQQFTQLCQLMGAKSVTLNYTSNKKADESTSFSAEANFKGAVNAEAGVKSEIVSNILGQMESVTVFKGNDNPDIEGAKKLMSTGVFSNNSNITSFYHKACNVKNRMMHEKVSMKLAEEVSNKLEVFAKIQAPIFKNSIGEVNFEKVKNASCVSEINYEVIF